MWQEFYDAYVNRTPQGFSNNPAIAGLKFSGSLCQIGESWLLNIEESLATGIVPQHRLVYCNRVEPYQTSEKKGYTDLGRNGVA
jgi:hypothetical protein